MAHIAVVFGRDRSRCGHLTLIGDDGAAICGPFPVAGRSSDSLAAQHGNPSRDQRLPYGDTPVGDYRVSELKPVASEQANALTRLGEHGVIVLEAVDGDAAIAEANGRYRFWIHGGAAGPGGALRSTAGALRLEDSAMRELAHALADTPRVTLRCVEDDDFAGAGAVVDDEGCQEVDPPLDQGPRSPMSQGPIPVPRRRVLQGGAAATSAVFTGAVSFFTPNLLAGGTAFAQTAYPGPGGLTPFPNPPEPNPPEPNPPEPNPPEPNPPEPNPPEPNPPEPIPGPETGVTEPPAPGSAADVSGGLVQVNASEPTSTILEKIQGPVTDLALDLENNALGRAISPKAVPYLQPAAKLAVGLGDAARLYSNGQTDAAVGTVKSALSKFWPAAVSAAYGAALAPTLPATVVAVTIGAAAMGVTLSETAIVITSVVIVVGASVAVDLAATKAIEGYTMLGQIALEHIRATKTAP